MREIREQEEEEKLQDLKESIMDVTKQRDMSGFYKWVKVIFCHFGREFVVNSNF